MESFYILVKGIAYIIIFLLIFRYIIVPFLAVFIIAAMFAVIGLLIGALFCKTLMIVGAIIFFFIGIWLYICVKKKA